MSVSHDELRGMILLDNGAQNSLFCRMNILTDVQERSFLSTYIVIGGDAVSASNNCLFLKHMKVDYSPQATANVISWSQAINSGANIQYNADNSFSFELGGRFFVFKPFKQLYACRNTTAHTNLNRRQQAEVDITAEIQRRIAFPSTSGLDHLVRSEAIMNLPLGTSVIRSMEDSFPYLQRKSVTSNPRQLPEIRSTRDEEYTILYGDLMHIMPNDTRLDFLITTSDFGITFIRPLKLRGISQIGL